MKKKAVKKTAKKRSATVAVPKVPPVTSNTLQVQVNVSQLIAAVAALESRVQELETIIALQKKPAIPSWREWPVYWGLTR